MTTLLVINHQPSENSRFAVAPSGTRPPATSPKSKNPQSLFPRPEQVVFSIELREQAIEKSQLTPGEPKLDLYAWTPPRRRAAAKIGPLIKASDSCSCQNTFRFVKIHCLKYSQFGMFFDEIFPKMILHLSIGGSPGGYPL